jgi:hypothetical protein
MRVRKARRQSVCPICRSLILVGQQVCLPPGMAWTHTRCWLGVPLTEWTRRARP